MKPLEFLEFLTMALLIPALILIFFPLGLAVLVGWFIKAFA